MSGAEVTCPDCDGYGVMGGRGSYYDTPGKMKPCGTCNGRKVVSRGDESSDEDDTAGGPVGPDR